MVKHEDRFFHLTELFHPTLQDWENFFAAIEEARNGETPYYLRELPKTDNGLPWD